MTEKNIERTSGIKRRSILKGAAAAGAIGFIGLPAATGSVAADSHIETVEIPLTWQRSAETPSGVSKSDVLGGAVPAGFSLPTYPDGSVPGTTDGKVWNEAQYYQGANAGGLPDPGAVDFATWEQWDAEGGLEGGCATNDETPFDGSDNGDWYQVRRFTADFSLPAGVSTSDITDVSLYSPYVTDRNIIPINDNFYVTVNDGTLVHKGTAAVVWPGAEDPTEGPLTLSDTYGPASRDLTDDTLTPSDGWFFNGSLGSAVAGDIVDGSNTIDLVVEEFCNWGGMTRLALEISYEVPQCEECAEGDMLAKYEWVEGDEEVMGHFMLEGAGDDYIVLDEESVTLDEDGEPVYACFDVEYCDLDAVVKAGQEYDVFESDTGRICVSGFEAETPGGQTVTHAISNVRFYCDAPEDKSVGNSGGKGRGRGE